MVLSLGICQQKQLKLTAFSSAAQRKISAPLSEFFFGISHQQQNCIFFCRAAKDFAIVNKSNSLFCRAARIFELRTRTVFCLPRSENFVYQQKQLKSTVSCSGAKSTVFCSAAQRNLLEMPTKETQMNCLQLWRKREREEKVDRWKQRKR
jgi:hypothetical protein